MIIDVLDNGRLNAAQELLAGVPDGMDRAMKNAMRRAAQNLRSNSVKAIREKYDISAGTIREKSNVNIY